MMCRAHSLGARSWDRRLLAWLHKEATPEPRPELEHNAGGVGSGREVCGVCEGVR